MFDVAPQVDGAVFGGAEHILGVVAQTAPRHKVFIPVALDLEQHAPVFRVDEADA